MGDSVPVQLYVYDMTNGVAAVMSQMLLGQQIDGIWHTAVVVYGREFFYGGSGIQSCMPVSYSTKFRTERQTHFSTTKLCKFRYSAITVRECVCV